METSQFTQLPDISQSSGSFSITLAPYSIYSLTTTTGQTKGAPASIPAATDLTLPYTDNFESYAVGTQPKYMIDQGGAFEVVSGNGGKILQQQLTATTKPVDWVHVTTPNPFTVFGSPEWRNYQIQVDAKIVNSTGYILVGGRAAHLGKSIALDTLPDGYALQVNSDASWQIRNRAAIAASGAAGSLTGFTTGTWHTFLLTLNGTTVTASMDGASFASASVGYIASGSAFLGSDYNPVQFDNLSVTQINGTTPVAITRTDDKDSKLIYQGEWENVDGSYDSFARTLTASRHSAATFNFSFTGTAVSIIGNRSWNGGQAHVSVDGGTAVVIDVYKDTSADLDGNGNVIPYTHQAIFNSGNLTAGTHSVQLIVDGLKQSASTDTYVWVDAVEVTGIGTTIPPAVTTSLVNESFDALTTGAPPPSDWMVTTPVNTSALIAADPSRSGKAFKLTDSSTTDSVKVVKKFSPMAGNFTVSFDYYAVTSTGKWNRAILKGLGVHAVELYDTDTTGLCYGHSDGTKTMITTISANTWYTIRIDLNMTAHTFDLYVNGTQYIFAAAQFDTTLTSVDRIDLETGVSFTGISYWDNFSVTTQNFFSRTYVDDDFNAQPGITTASNYAAADDPYFWTATVSPYVYPGYTENVNVFARIDSTLPGTCNQSMWLHDYHSTKAMNVDRRFQLTGNATVTLLYSFRLNATGSNSSMSVRGHSDEVIKLVDTAANGLVYTTSAGTQVHLTTLTTNTWYSAKIVANPLYGVYDLYINDVLLLSDQAMMRSDLTAGIDNLLFCTDPVVQTTDLHIDDVKISVP